jgi:hypothetical protein
MPQMFDWIFFAIIIPPPLFLLWDLLRDRAAQVGQMKGTGSGMAGSTMTRPSSYAVPGATTASTTAVGSGAGTLDPVGMPAETTAQRDANMDRTR